LFSKRLLLSLVDTYKQKHPNLYQTLASKEPADSEVASQISCDLNRTFPDHPLFTTPESRGYICTLLSFFSFNSNQTKKNTSRQKSLARILRAFANYNTNVGYCQGQNFIAGLLYIVFLNEVKKKKKEWILITENRKMLSGQWCN
jgi:hypothetical protein